MENRKGISVRELAEYLGVVKQTVYNEIHDGRLGFVKMGRNRIVILPNHLEKRFGKEISDSLLKALGIWKCRILDIPLTQVDNIECLEMQHNDCVKSCKKFSATK